MKSNNVYFIEEGGGQRLSVASMVEKGSKKVARLTGGVADGTGTGFKARPVTKDTMAYLVFSSGTSGPPKGTFLLSFDRNGSDCLVAVMISHGNLIFALMQHGATVREVLKVKV